MTKRAIQTQLCDMCGRVVQLPGAHELADGRVVCPTCHRTGLNTIEEVEEVRRMVVGVFKQFGMELKEPAPLRVVNAEQMAALSGLRWRPSMHQDARPMGGYGLARQGEVIHVESGQPPDRLLWTLAHESAHDWHADNNPAFPLLDEELQEGFAQWAADEVAGRLGHKALARRQLNRADVYGLAPKRFFRLEAVAGVGEVLAFAREIGAGRVLRVFHQTARGDQRALARELRARYSGWRKAVDFSADAERLERQGHFFASALCLGLALRALPIHPKLWWRWLRRTCLNRVLLMTFSAGRPIASLRCWLTVTLLAALIGLPLIVRLM